MTQTLYAHMNKRKKINKTSVLPRRRKRKENREGKERKRKKKKKRKKTKRTGKKRRINR
jgi:hypothetical protein